MVLNLFLLFLSVLLAGCGSGFCALVGCGGGSAANPNILPASISVARVYPNTNAIDSNLWNYYVLAASTTSDCNPAVDTACIHGGERRKVVVTGVTSCDNLSASDSLTVFEWRCELDAGTATFFTNGFQDGKGLKDLLDPTSFLTLSVTVNYLTYSVTSPATTWWSNDVKAAPTGGGVVHTLTTAYDIYTLSADTSERGYSIEADGIGLVMLSDATLTYTDGANNCSNLGETGGDQECTVFAGSEDHLWLEGDIDGAGGLNRNIFWSSVRFSKIWETGSTQATFGAYISSANYNFVGRSNFSGNISYGLFLASSLGTRVAQVAATASNEGLSAFTSSDDLTVVSSFFPYNGNIDYNVNIGSDSAWLGAITAGAGKDMGILIVADKSSVMSASVDGSNIGLRIAGATNGYFSDIVASNTPSSAVSITGGTHLFKGELIVGSGNSCNITGGTVNVSGAAAPCATGDAELNLALGVDATSAYVASVPGGDAANLHVTETIAFGSLTDWTHFSNRFRGWGFSSGIFTEGECDSTTCQVYDWRLNDSDAILRNVLACPSGTEFGTHEWSDTSTSNYLRRAIEPMTDTLGDNDGLCESGETCLYIPNIGSYQGHGDLVSASTTSNACADIGTGGTITNVTLLQYETNGVAP